jgi:DNA replication and repair protein RecF
LGQVLGKSMVANIIYQHRDKILDFKDLLEIKNQLIDWHEEVAQLELRRKITLFGAHLDDMVIELNGHNVKHLASRGQTRALVVSFKMALMLAIERMRNISPIVILDDIVSELDRDTKNNLFGLIRDLKAQTFLSATDLSMFSDVIKSPSVFKLNQGSLD